MPATNSVTKRYYPALSEVTTVDFLPEFLHFAEDGLNLLLDRIHYKNLQYSKSYRGDAAFYSLDIISKNIGIAIPFGLCFVLNPDINSDSAISSFPISVKYQYRNYNYNGTATDGHLIEIFNREGKVVTHHHHILRKNGT